MISKIIDRTDIVDQLLPMTEVEQHCRVYDPHENELLMAYRLAAISYAERYMNRVIAPCVATATFTEYKSRVFLPLGDVQSLLSIEAVDRSGNVVMIDRNAPRLNSVSNELVLPAELSGFQDFVVEYEVGYKLVEDVPAAIKIGLLKLIATWYENREDVSNGISVAKVPFNHTQCFELYRIPAGA
ncbi:head-tail connector protein [Vibrio fluvialis]|uniref:hypothetical protein n=1 Tax=Vibrio fluvialis TaxID=676 RepID=UPI0028DD93FD|nr:hypothetical protein [Vibrio fluvialis]MDT8865855.1 hypothetical protein [Vibrio fluvialis]MDT8873623.1 hypothetical protein [Vibrio fluvialis]